MTDNIININFICDMYEITEETRKENIDKYSKALKNLYMDRVNEIITQEEFDIEIEQNAAESIVSVGDVVEQIKNVTNN